MYCTLVRSSHVSYRQQIRLDSTTKLIAMYSTGGDRIYSVCDAVVAEHVAPFWQFLDANFN